MQTSGMSHGQALSSLENMVQSQAVMVSTNHIFLLISVLMAVSVSAIWFSPRPKGPVAGAANAH
jgi:DHA2 family multidrug resistance protein